MTNETTDGDTIMIFIAVVLLLVTAVIIYLTPRPPER